METNLFWILKVSAFYLTFFKQIHDLLGNLLLYLYDLFAFFDRKSRSYDFWCRKSELLHAIAGKNVYKLLIIVC
jgi:hypothetical protein